MRRSKLLRVAGTIVVLYLTTIVLVAVTLRWKVRSTGDETSDEIALAAAANGIELHSRAAAFRGGSAKAIMGGMQLDIRQAVLAPEGGRLEVEAILGGVEVLVPESWRIRIAPPRTILGGVDYPDDVDASLPSDAPELELSLHAILGGIEVKQQAPDPAIADVALHQATDA